MKPDLQWPVPPRYGVPIERQPKPDLLPSRAYAVARLAQLADIAESQVLPRDGDGRPTLLPDDRPYRHAAGFVRWCLDQWQRGLVADDAALKDNADLLQWAREHEDNVLIIDRSSLHLLNAIRGDLILFHDGQCGIVTGSQCSGCRHCSMAAFTTKDEVPSVVTVPTAWLVNVKALVRIVLREAQETEAHSAEGKREKGKGKSGRTPKP